MHIIPFLWRSKKPATVEYEADGLRGLHGYSTIQFICLELAQASQINEKEKTTRFQPIDIRPEPKFSSSYSMFRLDLSHVNQLWISLPRKGDVASEIRAQKYIRRF